MSNYNYKSIINFGSNVAPTNPLDVCLNDTIDNKFQAGVLGDLYGQHSDKCQLLLAQHCSNNWDGFCELASKNTSRKYPNLVQSCYTPSLTACKNLTAGENLIRNAAFKKFCKTSGEKKCEPFNPTDPTSPMVCYNINPPCYNNSGCAPVCRIDNIEEIDKDPLILKMITNPHTCLDILINIYKCAKREGTLDRMMKTNLGKFFKSYPKFFN